MFKGIPSTFSQVFVLVVDDESKDTAIGIAQQLRESGISCEINLRKRSLTKQLDYMNSKKIPFAVIVGSRDLAKKEVTVKDMGSGNEIKAKVADVVKAVENLFI
jgi:histidyl-tRNA synthetase